MHEITHRLRKGASGMSTTLSAAECAELVRRIDVLSDVEMLATIWAACYGDGAEKDAALLLLKAVA
jgi:hypothetical protein